MSTKAMSSVELRELRGLVRDRFKIIKKQIPVKEDEIKEQVYARLDEAAREKIAAFNERGKVLMREVHDLDRRVRDLVREGQDEGVLPMGFYGGRRHYVEAIDGLEDWKADVVAEFKTELRRVKAEAASALLEVERREVELLTELTVDSLSSDAARGFLDKIPTVEQFVPTPPKALRA